jgi:hypothetical protein
MILYLTSKANVNLLDSIELEQELPVKKLIGQFSLHSFVVKDMRHFSHVRYIAIDRKAALESDKEVIHALMTFQTMYDIRIIVIAEGFLEENQFLYELIQAGITNVATSEHIETLLQEIKECFSEKGMQRFIPVTKKQITESNSILLSNKDSYQFTCNNIRIAIAGSDRRTGVTTTAMNLVYWINEHGGNGCYLEANSSKHLAHIIHLFEPEKSGNAYKIENADLYLTSELNSDYNFIVMDCGVLGDPLVQDSFINADVKLLCSSAMPYDLPIFYRALERCKGLPVYTVGLFVPENLKSYLLQEINNDIIFGDSSHDLFDSKINHHLYIHLLKEYIN